MGKPLRFFLWALIFVFASLRGFALDADTSKITVKGESESHVNNIKAANPQQVATDTPATNQKNKVFHKKHRLIAALLAFPVPFGVFGAHRMYMHSSAKVPLLYIATLGGGIGILPFIDFVLILLNKDIHLNYTSNSHLFMWQKR